MLSGTWPCTTTRITNTSRTVYTPAVQGSITTSSTCPPLKSRLDSTRLTMVHGYTPTWYYPRPANRLILARLRSYENSSMMLVQIPLPTICRVYSARLSAISSIGMTHSQEDINLSPPIRSLRTFLANTGIIWLLYPIICPTVICLLNRLKARELRYAYSTGWVLSSLTVVTVL
jgi:hypothetical protein